jgi:hypothetical protein
MERAIGDYGKKVQQPSNLFGNLSKIVEHEAHMNALLAIYPDLNTTPSRHQTSE